MCDVVDAGTEWQFVDGQPFPDFEPFCSSKCVDFPGTLTLFGQSDLRKVPLLPKLRKVNRLIINVEGLPDLRGLEKVDIENLLNLVTNTQKMAERTFSSTAGLEDDTIDIVDVSGAPGLKSLGNSLRKATTVSITDTGLVSLDLSDASIAYLNIYGNKDLRTVSLGSGVMNSASLEANSTLDDLTWGALTVRQSILISGNPRLSTCRAEDFARDAGAPRTTVLNNGPCP